MAYTLVDLIESNIKDHKLAKDLIDFLSTFVTSDEVKDIDFDTEEGLKKVPTLKKILSSIQNGTIESDIRNVSDRMNKADTLTSIIIAKLAEMGATDSPVWRSYPLEDGSLISDMSDPMYRANVEDAVRFPFDAFIEVQMERRNPSEWVKIGQDLLPNHKDVLIHGFTNPTSPDVPIVSGTSNASAYPAFKKTIITKQKDTFSYRYGRYYKNVSRTIGKNGKVTTNTTNREVIVSGSRTVVKTSSRVVSTPLPGSQVAQSFKTERSVILKGIRLWSATAGSSFSKGDPYLQLTDNTVGTPDLEQVLAKAYPVKDTAFSLGAGAITTTVTNPNNFWLFNFENPILIEKDKSYSFVIVSPDAQTINLAVNNNAYSRGGLFFSQDGSSWIQDLAKDISFSLVVAEFTEGEQSIELQPLSVSGGIAAIKTNIKSVQPEGTSFRLEVQLNNVWRDVELIDSIDTLPPFTPVRLVVNATKDLATIIDSVGSQITAFRPANSLHFTAKVRPTMRVGNVRLSVSMMEFDKSMHTVSFKLKGVRNSDGSSGDIEPSFIREVTSNNNTAQFEVSFDINNKEEYQLILTGTTKLATRTFEVNAITEI